MHSTTALHPVEIAPGSRPARARAGELKMARASVPRSTVLVVDHNLMTGALLRTALEREGYAVELARDPEHVLERIEAGGIDLVLLDQRAPDSGGFEWRRRLRARSRELYLPVIMLTERVRAAHPVASLAAGVAYYLTKPFDLPELLHQVRVWTQARERLRTFYARLLRAAEGPTESDCATSGSWTA
jgi:DNA-binding response OmpR family regulator